MCAFQDFLWFPNCPEIFQQEVLFDQCPTCLDDELVLPTNDVMITESSGHFKKLSHNANERQRRKKLNALYATLRSLLPQGNTQKTPSIPAVVCGVLKYIPRLQNQIEILARKRDRLLAVKKISEAAAAAEGPSILNLEQHLGQKEGIDLFDVTVTINAVSKTEVVVTVKSPPLLFSNLLVLFKQENLEVLYVSSFISHGILWQTIRLKAVETWSSDLNALRSKILLICHNSLRDRALQHYF